tara:strand:+ start:102 stop:599 length:498 start_codon:yes stop_codon:yes gene_type:complete
MLENSNQGQTPFSEEVKEIIKISLRYLSLREYSELELQKKIKRNYSFNGQSFSKAFEHLRSNNYLSADRFVKQTVKQLKSKGYSYSYISKSLSLHNINRNTVDLTMCEIDSDLESIKKLISKKIHPEEIRKIDKKKFASIMRYIISKGHIYSEAKEVLNSLKRDL